MKNFIKLLSITFFALLWFTSCQDEVFQETPISQEELLVANSPLANLVQSTATMDGSMDNIIDHANCLSVELPVTVVVNGLEIIIDTVEDYNVIEAIFDEFDNDNDNLEIVFPITIILSDFSEIEISNNDELQNFINDCSGENEIDDDIECIDFQYPITFSIFNTSFQIIETVSIENDRALHQFIERLENSDSGAILASLNFPITMILSDGSLVEVTNNSELERVINAAKEDCNEDDDNDFNDDDIVVSPGQFKEILTSCTWTVDKLELGDQNHLEEEFVGYLFAFHLDGTVSVDSDGATFNGTWNLIVTDHGIQINLQFNDLPEFNNEHWILREIERDNDKIKIAFRNREDRLRFESLGCDINNNPTPCTELEVDNILMECNWIPAAISGSNDFRDYAFSFNDAQELVIKMNNGTSVTGNWMTTGSDNGVIITISELTDPLQLFNGEWKVINCGSERLVLKHGDIELVIERNCVNDVTPNDLFNIVTDGQWLVANYNDSGANETNTYSNWILTFNIDGTVKAENDSIIEGTWSGIMNDGKLKMVLNFGTQIPFDKFNDDWDVFSVIANRLELRDVSGGDGTTDKLVFEKI
jgi:hypothetical protein